MYFLRILIKIFTLCTMGKTNTFDSMLNFIKLQWQKNHLFLVTLFFPSSLRKRHINDDLREYISNFLKFHFIEDILQLKNYYMLLKKAWASTFWGVGQFAAFYRNVELVAKLDYCDWIYAVDEYCNFMITIKNGFSSEKNYS